MTSRSSIFSFDTLKLPRTFPKGAAFAACLLVAGELGVRGLMATGKLEPDLSLRRTLVRRIERMKAERPPVWVLGNSTLDWGVDESLLASLVGRPVIKLAHGSATVNASAAMLEFYIRQSGTTPKQVVLTITKDDLNRNGYRADRSQTYLAMEKADAVPAADWPKLREARGNIRDAATNAVQALRPGHAEPAAPVVKAYTGKPLDDTSKVELNLIKNFDPAMDWFADLKAVCTRHGIAPPVVVLMPVTDQYVTFHDKFIDKKLMNVSYANIYAKTLTTLAADGITVVDYWKQPRTDYALFRDPYHLNPGGAIWFTKKLAAQLKPLLDAPTTRPASSPTSP